ncbi:hypothetical protein CsSME_00011898 [Camellia sinensis var. sinensis]
MASLHCSASTLPSQSILGFRRPTIRTSTTPLTLAANVPLTPSNFRGGGGAEAWRGMAGRATRKGTMGCKGWRW